MAAIVTAVRLVNRIADVTMDDVGDMQRRVTELEAALVRERERADQEKRRDDIRPSLSPYRLGMPVSGEPSVSLSS